MGRDRNIVLVGFMGTGKTEVGRRLAKRLGRAMIDTDRMIVREAKRSIPDIFRRGGEREFRKLERRAIQNLKSTRKAVIATGGGAILDPQNLRALQENGLLFCLEASPRAIASRVGMTKRPMLKGSNRLMRIRRLLNSRRASYQQADVQLDTTGRSPQAVSNQIEALFRGHPMERIRVDLSANGYDILVGSNTLPAFGEQLRRLGMRGQVALISHPRISRLYGRAVETGLSRAGFRVRKILIPEGEKHKSLRHASKLYDALIRHRFERSSCLIALGGGVIGDLVGFTAATYLRGIPYCQIPTSLAAQVDASIGGKTAVNHAAGKNLIGAFHQPKLVFIDTQVLRSLSEREFRSGLSEVIKYGVILDEAFFVFLEQRMQDILKLDDDLLRLAIRRSCEIKASVVKEDERESGLRKILNYGHTLGHALESTQGYGRFLHGEAVAMGISFAARLAGALRLCPRPVVDRQISLLKQAGLPTSLPKIKTADILKHMKADKKVVGGAIHFVLAKRIGHVMVRPVSEVEIRELFKSH